MSVLVDIDICQEKYKTLRDNLYHGLGNGDQILRMMNISFLGGCDSGEKSRKTLVEGD